MKIKTLTNIIIELINKRRGKKALKFLEAILKEEINVSEETGQMVNWNIPKINESPRKGKLIKNMDGMVNDTSKKNSFGDYVNVYDQQDEVKYNKSLKHTEKKRTKVKRRIIKKTMDDSQKESYRNIQDNSITKKKDENNTISVQKTPLKIELESTEMLLCDKLDLKH